jgi:archaetidylinositol phosphate synthase
VVLTRLRQSIKPLVDSVGRACSKLLPYPNAWTVAGALFALLSGISFYERFPLPGGLFILASGAMDVVDGAVARAVGKVSARGGFLDSNLDRLAEVFVYAGIAGSGSVNPLLSLLALSFSLLVSYTRAKAEGLGVKAEGVGIGERAERLLILAASGILGYLLYGVILVLALASVTFVQRLYVYSSRL